MARLIWTEESKWWLREIDAHVSRDKPEAARRVVCGSSQKAPLALEFPDAGAGYSVGRRTLRPPRPPLRPVQDRLIRLILTATDVYVLGVLYGALDLRRHLRLR